MDILSDTREKFLHISIRQQPSTPRRTVGCRRSSGSFNTSGNTATVGCNVGTLFLCKERKNPIKRKRSFPPIHGHTCTLFIVAETNAQRCSAQVQLQTNTRSPITYPQLTAFLQCLDHLFRGLKKDMGRGGRGGEATLVSTEGTLLAPIQARQQEAGMCEDVCRSCPKRV